MKKRDIKYIIKRIIIGVGIVFIVGFINKCSVKAESPNVYLNGSANTCSSGSLPNFIYYSQPSFYNEVAVFNEMVNSTPTDFYVFDGNSHSPTRNSNGYYFVLSPIDNAFKYYFVVTTRNSTNLSELVVNAVNFDFSSGTLQIKVYNENGDLIPDSYLYFYSFVLSNKNEIIDNLLESYMYIYPDSTTARYYSYTTSNEGFRLSLQAYYSASYQTNCVIGLTFPLKQDTFSYLRKVDSTIPFVLINDSPIENVGNIDAYESGLNGDNTYGNKIFQNFNNAISSNNPLISLIDFIKIPFDFLNSLKNTTCQPISITIPFVGGNLQFPCISSLLSSNVPQLYNILVIVINGLLIYRITIKNIDTITDSLNSDDDKLEVLAL